MILASATSQMFSAIDAEEELDIRPGRARGGRGRRQAEERPGRTRFEAEMTHRGRTRGGTGDVLEVESAGELFAIAQYSKPSG